MSLGSEFGKDLISDSLTGCSLGLGKLIGVDRDMGVTKVCGNGLSVGASVNEDGSIQVTESVDAEEAVTVVFTVAAQPSVWGVGVHGRTVGGYEQTVTAFPLVADRESDGSLLCTEPA